MRMIAVDDERGALSLLKEAIREAVPSAQLCCFERGREAVQYAETHPVDIAFLDVEMPGMDGLELAKQLKELRREVNIIFITGYSQYAVDAIALRASGYLVKPVTKEDVEQEIENLRYPVVRERKGIYVHTFGNFDVLADGTPISFRRSKSKEILAYLVDRKGATVTKKEIAAMLWEDGAYTRSRQFQIQTLVTEMIRTLRSAGAEGIVRKNYNSYSVNPSRFECDYYQFNRCDAAAVNAYYGEYMSNYSWVEFTAGGIEKERDHRSSKGIL